MWHDICQDVCVKFKDGRPVEMITGLTSRSKLEETIKGVIKGAPAKQPFIVQ